MSGWLILYSIAAVTAVVGVNIWAAVKGKRAYEETLAEASKKYDAKLVEASKITIQSYRNPLRTWTNSNSGLYDVCYVYDCEEWGDDEEEHEQCWR